MATRLTKLQNRTSGLPAEDHRLLTTLGSPGANLHGRAGYLPAASGFTGAVTLLSNTQYTVDAGRWIIPGTQSTVQGDYPVANDAQVTKTIPAQQTGLTRIDLVVVQVRDTAYTPNEGQNDALITHVTGTPASSGAVAPTPPPNSLVLGAFTVPPPGSPVTFTAALLDGVVALGGIRPARAADASVGRYLGEHKWDPTLGTQEWAERTLGNGVWARHARHWGTVANPAAYPSSPATGDTVIVTSLASSLMRFNGSAWRQAEVAEVASRTARNALSAGLHAGFRVLLVDEGWYYRWDGSAWVYTGANVNPNTAITTPGHAPTATYRQSGVQIANNSDTFVSGYNNNRVDLNVITFDPATGRFTFPERGMYDVLFRASGDGANPARQLHYLQASPSLAQQAPNGANWAFDGQSSSGYTGAGILTLELHAGPIYCEAGDYVVSRVYQVNGAGANRVFDLTTVVTKLPYGY